MKNCNQLMTEQQHCQQHGHISIVIWWNKYEYLTGEEILLSDQSGIIYQAKFTYSSLRNAFEKQIKTIEDQGIKQVEALKL